LKKKFLYLFFICSLLYSKSAFPWGAEGHKMVAAVAKSHLKKSVIDSVQKYLGDLSFEDAATWMDDVRKDKNFNYMKTWHYINIEKGAEYVANEEVNIVNQLKVTIAELKKRNSKSAEEINLNLKVLFHLVGDLHQPLHVGYGSDRGGNTVDVQFKKKKANLHHVWDSNLINELNLNTEQALIFTSKLNKRKIKKIQKIDIVGWMNESRCYLPEIYNLQDSVIGDEYIAKNKRLVENQIAYAGLRLAKVLNEIFS